MYSLLSSTAAAAGTNIFPERNSTIWGGVLHSRGQEAPTIHDFPDHSWFSCFLSYNSWFPWQPSHALVRGTFLLMWNTVPSCWDEQAPQRANKVPSTNTSPSPSSWAGRAFAHFPLPCTGWDHQDLPSLPAPHPRTHFKLGHDFYFNPTQTFLETLTKPLTHLYERKDGD